MGGWKGLRPSQPSVAASLQFLGAWPPVLKKKSRNLLLGNRLRYGDGGEVKKDLSWHNRTFVTLESYLYFTPNRQYMVYKFRI